MGKNAIIVGCAAALGPVVLALLGAACSSNSGPSNQFKVGGHTCTQFDPGSPSCDGTPPNATCTAPASACWATVAVSASGVDAGTSSGEAGASMGATDGGPAPTGNYYALCPACCTGNNASIMSPKANCLYPISCTTQLECPFESQCIGGTCQ